MGFIPLGERFVDLVDHALVLKLCVTVLCLISEVELVGELETGADHLVLYITVAMQDSKFACDTR
jgi:hypothetical protein